MTENPTQIPHVTILTTNYNKGDFLCKAVQSAIDQDYPNKSIYVIDDASTDGSCDKLLEYLGLNDTSNEEYNFTFAGCNIYIQKLKQNVGRSKVKNIAIKKIVDNSHIIAFLDSDDEYMPTKISKSVIKIMDDPSAIGLVYTDYLTKTKDGLITPELKAPFDNFQLKQHCLISSNCVVTTLALKQVGIFDEEMIVAEDWDLWLRITRQFVAIHIPEILVHMNISDNNATISVSTFKWQQDWSRIRAKMEQGIYG